MATPYDSPNRFLDEKGDVSNDDLRGGNIVEGSEDVTEYELATLRHIPDRLPYTSWLIVVVEFAERYVVQFSYRGRVVPTKLL